MDKSTQGAWTLRLVGILFLAGVISSLQPALAQLGPTQIEATTVLLRAGVPATAVGQSATLLPDGRWLLLGGVDADRKAVAAGVLLDARSRHSIALANPLTFARSGHTATVLPDGSVLILGGEGADGHIVSTPEVFDPKTQAFQSAAGSDLLPRQLHTATLLTDGRLLIVGGLDEAGNVLAEVELLDTLTGAVERFDYGLETARFGHLAALLPSAPVLVWGGLDSMDRPSTSAELFEPQSNSLGPIDATRQGYLPDALASLATPAVTGVYPEPTTEIAPDSILSLRFSKSLDVTTLTAATVTLFGPTGVTATRVVPAEAGMLLFVTPEQELTPGAYYTLFVSGAKDTAGIALPFTALRFQTRVLRMGRALTTPPTPGTPPPGDGTLQGGLDSHTGASGPAPEQTPSTERPTSKTLTPTGDDEIWIPGPDALRGNWRSKRFTGEIPQLKALKAVDGLVAADGVTAVSGQVLRLNGLPLANVTVSMNGQVAYTDGAGRFLLANVSPGWQRLSVEGATANRPDAQYGRHDMRVYVTSGKTSPLVWTVWLPKLDMAHVIHLDSPTQHETILSSPYIPGLEFRVPAGTVIRDRAGKIVTEVTITPVPIDQPSHPLPEVHIPGYFTLQPSGLRFESATGGLIEPVRLRYPNNDPFFKVGSPATFWSYDPDQYGWQVYAEGRVGEDNVVELPVDGMHGFRSWEDGMHSGGPPPGPPGPCPCPNENCKCAGGPPGGPPLSPSPPNSGPVDGGEPGIGPLGGDDAGDPCSVSTGQFTLVSTDLSVRDLMSFDVTRVYRPNDTRILPFGIGTTWPFGMYVYGNDTGGLTSHPLVMANGSRVYFDNVNNDTSHGGMFVNTTSPGVFFGAVLNIAGGPPEIFTIRRKDGTLYTFDGSGNLLEIRSRTGATISIDRTGAQVNRITSPSGRWLSFTYSGGLISQVQDQAGRTVTYGYTNSYLTSVTNANNETWTYGYDANGRMSTITDPRHNVMLTNTYDSNGRITTQTYADNSTVKFTYTLDTNGNVTQTNVTDRNGAVRQVQLDATGYVQQDTAALGAPEQQTITFTRDPTTHQLLSTTDALARRTDLTYDTSGNVLKVTKLAGSTSAVTTTYTYEPTFNQISSITDALNHKTTVSHDANGNATQLTDPLNNKTTMTYDSQGQLLTVTNALNKTTRYTYDTGVLASVTDPLSHTTTMFRDALGRVIRVVDSAGNGTTTTYDVLDRVTRVTDPLGNSVGYEYDANGNLTAHVDQNSNRTVYAYDAMNRVTSREDALLHSDTYVYDGSSMLNQSSDRLSEVTGYSYDNLHRRTQVGFGATPSNPTAYTSTVGYAYDAGNRMLSAVDSASGPITRSYDGLNRLTQEVTPNGTVSYTYYANGLRQTMLVSGQPVITYGYDNSDRLTSIVQGSLTVDFAYDSANRRTQISLPNGVIINYGYDDAGHVTAINYQKGATALGNLTYTYDAAGRRVNVGGTFAGVSLPAAITSATYNSNNQLVSWAGQSYSYDLNGNLTSDGTQTYSWNSRQQLSGIRQGSGSVASYDYDATGRRASKTLAGSTTSFMYDGFNFVQEQQGSTVLANLITGLSLDEVYVRQAASNEYFLADTLNTVMELTDPGGAITLTYSYEPYGAPGQTGTESSNNQLFTGREVDASTGLMYYRARYYMPRTGRFISEDPFGLEADSNLYRYALGDPLDYADPRGESIGAVVVVVGVGAACYTLACVGHATWICSIRYPNWRDTLNPDNPKFWKCFGDLFGFCMETGEMLRTPLEWVSKKIGEHLARPQ